jgi:hypothetical protein
VKTLDWVRFFTAVLPMLTDLARELFKRHAGDVDGARSELRAIRDHGARLEAAEAGIDARLEALRARDEGK